MAPTVPKKFDTELHRQVLAQNAANRQALPKWACFSSAYLLGRN